MLGHKNRRSEDKIFCDIYTLTKREVLIIAEEQRITRIFKIYKCMTEMRM